MNHARQDHHHHDKPRRQIHKDWRVWIAVVLILAAMGVFVLTNGEALWPGRAPRQPVPEATGP